jgi:hypothetical protein
VIRPVRPAGFPTRSLLAGHEAAAAGLRTELDQLRRTLEQGPAPLTPVRRRGRKPLLGLLVVGGTLAVIATATLLPWSDLDLPGRYPDQGTSASRNPAGSASAVGPAGSASAVGRGAPALAPRSAPAGSLPTSGPGIDAPGTMMLVQVGPDGVLNVTEQALLGPRGLRRLRLSLPSTSSLGGTVATLRPRVKDLRVAINAVPVSVLADDSGWSVTADSQRARTVQLSYRLTGSLVHSERSEAGRALAVSLPLLGQALRAQGLPLVVRAEGAISALTCPSAPAEQMLCGTEAAKGWIAAVPAAATTPALLLQLNLTAP